MSEEKDLEVGDIQSLHDELETTKIKAAENLAGWQRAQADYANFKKETEDRRKDVVEFANAAFMSEVLPIYNNFKLALGHIPEDQLKLDWVIGLEHIKKQFQEFLKKYKIEEIKTVGEKFNHNCHEAVAHEDNDKYESDMVFAEVQPGYTLNGKILMPAKVKVSK
ncbi:nucleotide exchange factor GrpE [Candidatus Falkowbacteria bacterium]|uniref:Protein GrpE n=1 Tax=Candidatus Buchananbacteria bacterium CG10_big_fil_rev_8_21_14_0_10_33_19 TaxID=1974525 RepID=A0A2H0W3F9_9BACT|nr:nucleotide exchange factor GrpE [Candidatus Falkowbacteria bacterium]PIS05902.1 MAG: nucleotide exchange factor GrpE [Candidatus Buchananbacteria bacterium CG10_big_fil_rev_8_21_14_0_10_33_19]